MLGPGLRVGEVALPVDRVARELKAGTVWINTYHVYDNALPFGGYKQSGWGRELGKDSLEHYTETKSVVVAQ